MKFIELAGGFVEVFVVEFGDTPLFGFHLLTAILMEFLHGGADLLGEGKGLKPLVFGVGVELWEWEGFKTGIVSVSSIAF